MSVSPKATRPATLQIDAILTRLGGLPALEEVCRFLRSSFSHYRWVGIYRKDGDSLVLDTWNGDAPTEHTRIPIERGVCGRAVREGRTVIVDDVRSDPEYLACFLETRSEIVVPIRDATGILGEIDIDGNHEGAFDASDRQFLESVAVKLGRDVARVAANPPPPD
ncbi:MAG: GAF domain-containing protein [Thermoplasmata archaeon]